MEVGSGMSEEEAEEDDQEVKMEEADDGVMESEDESEGEAEDGVIDTAAIFAKVNQARAASASGRKGPATLLLLQVLQEVPELLPELEEELASWLEDYGEELVREHGETRQAAWLYDNVTKSLPASKLLWYKKGCFLYQRCARYLPSLQCFQRCIGLDPMHFPAIDAADNIKTLAVDRWHFRMLNDRHRNQAYQRAICLAVERAGRVLQRPPVVLDIGTGTGLLSILAARAGAAHVYACETNQVLCQMAAEIVRRHGLSDRITVIHKASQELQLGSTDLPGRVDVVVTELVDSGLLGEHILPVLRYARTELLHPQHGIIVPSRATVHAVVIECPEIRRRGRYSAGEGVCLVADEAYTCEPLDRLQHKKLTREVRVGTLPLDGVGPSTDLPVLTTTLEVVESGVADAVAVWFDMHLLDWDPDSCVVSTCPGREECGWDQAIFFLPPTTVTGGATVRLECRVGGDDEQLRVSLHPAGQPPPTPEGAVLDAGEMDVAMANDSRRRAAYQTAVSRVLQASSSSSIGGAPHLHVLEWSGDFSLLSQPAITAGVEHVQVLTGSPASATALHRLLHTSSHGGGVAISCVGRPPESLALANQVLTSSGLPLPTLLVTDLVDGSGLLRQGCLHELSLARDLLLSSPTSPTIPAALTVVVQCLHCPRLLAETAVSLDNTCGVDVTAINALGTDKLRELRLADRSVFSPLSPATAALRLHLLQPAAVGGQGDDVVGRTHVVVTLTGSGSLHAVGFWFVLSLDEETELSTGPSEGGEEEEGEEGGGGYRQGAVLVPLPGGGFVQGREGDRVGLDVVVSKSRGVDVFLADHYGGTGAAE